MKRHFPFFMALLFAAPLSPASPETAPSTQPGSSRTAIIVVNGQIDDFTQIDLLRRFGDARKAGASTVILEINTYGGLLPAAMDISRFIKAQSDLHTVAFVHDKAISAGAMIATACDEIVMAPSSVLGDCAPIIFDTGGRLEPLPPTERAKAASPVLAEFEDSARRNGYDPRVLDAMVEVSGPLYVVESSTGERRVADEQSFKELTSQQWKPVRGLNEPVAQGGRLLTVGTSAAEALGLSRGVAATSFALAGQRGYVIVADLTPGIGDRIVELLGSQGIRFILLLLFLQSLYIAMHAPGHGAAEAIAFTSLALLLGVPFLTGYAQWWEIVLVLGGLALCAFEIFVFPGHGASLIVGTLMVLAGFTLTFAGRVPINAPSWGPAWHAIEHGLIVVAAALGVTSVLSIWVRRFLPRMPFFKGLILTETSGGAATAAADMTRRGVADTWPFAGTVGVAMSDLLPGGSARFPFGNDTRAASVVSAAGYIPAGSKLVVQEARGNRVVVRPVPNA